MKLILYVILLSLMTGCSALPTPLEMGDMIFIRTMGVDEQEGEVELTVSTGRRSRGLQREVEPSLTVTGVGSSISGGVVEVAAQSQQQVYYGYLDQLLLGEGYCQQGILPALEYFARDGELGLSAEVWSVTGTAADAIASGGEEGVDSRLATLQLEGIQGTAGLTRTAGELLTDILENGATYLPRLTPSAEGDGTLLSAGYTIIIGDISVNTLTGESARGLELLEGEPSGDVFRSSTGVVLDIWDASCGFVPRFEGDVLTGVEVLCQVTADLAEYQSQPTEEEMELLQQELAQREESRIELALEALQRCGGDAIGLGRELGMASPSRWEDIQQGWESTFPDLPVSVTVEVTIRRS